jgi:phenylalanyl-tRNA synthetase beta subunit
MTTAIGIQNAFNVEYTHMRRSMIPRLLLNVSENLKHAESFSFFEIGKIFKKDNTVFEETKMLAGICVGKSITELRSVLE